MRKYFMHTIDACSLAGFIYLVWKLVPLYVVSFAEKYPLDPAINMVTTITFVIVIYMMINWLREQVLKLID